MGLAGLGVAAEAQAHPGPFPQWCPGDYWDPGWGNNWDWNNCHDWRGGPPPPPGWGPGGPGGPPPPPGWHP
ncbi:Secreted protein antigen [Mycobacterium bohemicum DSM 44277]|uniref:Pilin n=2 Tax=Mycobacterium bohemicum TaxID=56425 RepID=A0A0U0W8L5_MYCBE|nr:Secreted protein antigen [Mycobacterium bohemicum DSM 44277]